MILLARRCTIPKQRLTKLALAMNEENSDAHPEPPMTAKEFKVAIDDLRLKGISAMQIAKMYGVDQCVISQFKAGRTPIPWDMTKSHLADMARRVELIRSISERLHSLDTQTLERLAK